MTTSTSGPDLISKLIHWASHSSFQFSVCRIDTWWLWVVQEGNWDSIEKNHYLCLTIICLSWWLFHPPFGFRYLSQTFVFSNPTCSLSGHADFKV
jgi:hypothetical protein